MARNQIEGGATVIDINMDDAMLDSQKEMQTFCRHISGEPAVAKASENQTESVKATESEICAQNCEQNAQNRDQDAQKAEKMSNLITATKIKRSMSEGQLMFDLTGGF